MDFTEWQSPMSQSDPRIYDNLALRYQRLFTTIVRVKSGTQMIADHQGFRRQTRDLLASVERQAGQAGYAQADVQNTNYAVVAFLDESILDSNDPQRGNWTPLHAELYGEAMAGENFFQNLDLLRNRRDSPQVADVLEVYYLCLLLGYRGRYAGYAQGRTQELIRYREELRARIEAVRGRSIVFWPGEGPGLPDHPVALSAQDRLNRTLQLCAVAALTAVPILWGFSYLLLSGQATRVRDSFVP
jgi:type VI secretion system protein ImpK